MSYDLPNQCGSRECEHNEILIDSIRM